MSSHQSNISKWNEISLKIRHLFDVDHLKREFVAGGAAGSLGIFIGFPFDLIKVRLQVFPDKFRGAVDCFRQAIQQEGVKGLYRGCLPPIVFQGLINSLLFVGESTTTRFLEPNLRPGQLASPTNAYIAGVCGGILQCVAMVPSDVVKCVMQVEASNPSSIVATAKQNAFAQTSAVVQRIYAREGIRGFYKGFFVTVAREAPSLGVYFLSYKILRDSFSKFQGTHTPSTSATLMAGGMAGALSWTVVYPFDVIKTNVQTGGPVDISTGTSYANRSVVFIARDLYARHGLSVFFRGLGTTVVRAFPVNAATFFFYEKVKEIFHFT